MGYKEVIFDLHNKSVGIARADCPAYSQRPSHTSDADSLRSPTVAPGHERPLRPVANKNTGTAKPNAQLPVPEPKMKWTAPSKEVVLAISAVAVITASCFTIRIRHWLGSKPEVKHVKVPQEDPDQAPSGRARPAANVMGSVVSY